MADKLLKSIEDRGDNTVVTQSTQNATQNKSETGSTSQTTTRSNEGQTSETTQTDISHQTQVGTGSKSTTRNLTETSAQNSVTAEKSHIGCEVEFVIPIRGGLGVVPEGASPAPSPCA